MMPLRYSRLDHILHTSNLLPHHHDQHTRRYRRQPSENMPSSMASSMISHPYINKHLPIYR